VRLLHATPSRNLDSILKAGLLARKSRGRLRAVWAAAPSRASWCVLHVVKRHRTAAERVILLEIDVPRCWLRRCNVRGLWFCKRDVPPECIRGVVTFEQIACSPAEDFIPAA
jgi:RNA:NAD 2'-phosphotransferase (TPT1/KptA family)